MKREIQYEDFEVEVRSVAKRKYEARVLRSPVGRVESRFVPPFRADELDGILAALEGRVRASSRAGRDLEWAEPGELLAIPEVEELGRKLFRALFRDDVARRFHESSGVTRERGGDRKDWGLRLRVTFNPNESFEALINIPWELLWDQRQFLCRSRLLPLVRSLNLPRPPGPLVAKPPLRVLLIVSNPRDLNPLETRREARLVRRALERNPAIETTVMARADVRQLRSQLFEGGYHIVHFMGHGGFHETGRDPFVLYFEGRGRQAEPVTAMQLAEYLQDAPNLRLVVLNSCWSGAFPRHGGDPFSGVAAALIARGMPAVVAMQFPISDDAAIAFSQAFYESLAAGDPVSAAVTEGRLAILAGEPDSLEWVTPALFLTGEDRLFDLRRKGPRRTRAAAPAPSRPRRTVRPQPEEPLRLAIHSFRDPFVSEARPPDHLLDLTRFFNGRYIKDPDLWRAEVYPRLRAFLLRHASARRPIVLDFAAHLTLAFAAGYCLEAKSGLDLAVWQRSRSGVQRWQAMAGPAPDGALWQGEPDLPLSPRSSAVAVAVSATWPVLEDVKLYLRKSRKSVGRLVPATVPKPGQDGVRDGLHALQLAQDLSLKIRDRSVEERAHPLHLFASAPNALLFFLGQLGRGFGEVQLYEHDFEARKPGAYIPSLRLPVPPSS